MIDWILNTLWNIKWILFLLFIFNELSRVLITYNKIQTFTQKIEEARSNISIVLNQKLEIINQFSTVVSQYDEHEKGIQLKISNDYTKTTKDAANALSYIYGVAMAYPELRSDSNYNIFLENISNNERSLTERREMYNKFVKDYNTYITQIPTCILAKLFGYSRENYFNIN